MRSLPPCVGAISFAVTFSRPVIKIQAPVNGPGGAVGVEGEERARRMEGAVDVAVVAENEVGVAGVARGRGIARAVAGDRRAGAAVDDVRAVGPQGRGGQAEEAGAAADEVILAL